MPLFLAATSKVAKCQHASILLGVSCFCLGQVVYCLSPFSLRLLMQSFDEVDI